MNKWNEEVTRAFEKFAALKYNLLKKRVCEVSLTLSEIEDTFGFPRGTRNAVKGRIMFLRDRVSGRAVTNAWGKFLARA